MPIAGNEIEMLRMVTNIENCARWIKQMIPLPVNDVVAKQDYLSVLHRISDTAEEMIELIEK